jgi:uncharacterized membrane protein YgcG
MKVSGRFIVSLAALSSATVFVTSVLAADFPTLPPKGKLVLVAVNKDGCIVSKPFTIAAGIDLKLANQLAGRDIQVVGANGKAETPPIKVPSDIATDPNADIFEIIHAAYERHLSGDDSAVEPGTIEWQDQWNDPPTPREAQDLQDEYDRTMRPDPDSYGNPKNDSDYVPLPDKTIGDNGNGGNGGGGNGGGGNGGGGNGGGGNGGGGNGGGGNGGGGNGGGGNGGGGNGGGGLQQLSASATAPEITHTVCHQLK